MTFSAWLCAKSVTAAVGAPAVISVACRLPSLILSTACVNEDRSSFTSARVMPCTFSRSVSSWYWPEPGEPDDTLLPLRSRTLLMPNRRA
jgi:hypothetical protein